MLSLSDIVQATQARHQVNLPDFSISEIVTDSRKWPETGTPLFVALKTARNDGHFYIKDVLEKGGKFFLVSALPGNTEAFPDAVFMLVPDTLRALQQVARYIRDRYPDLPVIGITGSNGKTIVKEWLYQLLSPDFNVVRSPKSYNSQIGVPLSLIRIEGEHNMGVFEAGISQPGEMELLEKMIRPAYGIFTNIGEAHNQGFVNLRQKIIEKLQLFIRAQLLIYCADQLEVHEAVLHLQHSLKTNNNQHLNCFSWSYKLDTNLRITDIDKSEGRTRISAIYLSAPVEITIPFTDAASVENAIHCWCMLLCLNIEQSLIRKRMAALQPIAMRLEIRQGDHQCVIINDSYNSDLKSLLIALDLLDQQIQQTTKTVVLSDMYQTGRADLVLYTELAAILEQRKIDKFFGIGNSLLHFRDLFEANAHMECCFFPDTDTFLRHFHQFSFRDEAILLKGARSFSFEKLSLLLEQKIHQTVLQVNLSAMCNNLDAFRRRLKPQVKTMAMVKAASYGSGGHEIANMLKAAKVDYLTVAYADEGVALRKAKIDLPVMVMSPSAEAFDRMILWRLEPEIFNFRSLDIFLQVAANMNVQDYPVHIKLDTGMHRLGFMAEDIPALIQRIRDDKHIRIASIFSHLAAADDPSHDAFTQEQATVFTQMSDAIIGCLSYRPLRHLCNTAGIVRFPEYHFDMVRLGLGLYGIDSSGLLNNQLQQIGSLRTSIAQIRKVPAGSTIGYSRRGVATRNMRLATICIGYADGYPRNINQSGKAYVLINNKSAPVIGSIAMDMCMVDVTDIDAVEEGDEVIVFGDALPIQQLAEWAGTIPYEIMTGISQRVKRVYVNEG